MFRTLDDFFKSFENLTGATRKIFSALTDENLGQAVIDGHRKLSEITWHMVATYPEMMGHTGLKISSVSYETMPPASADEIRAGYEAVVTELASAIKARWTDESLLEVDEMYGEKWPKGLTLAVLIQHEIHHRGQMTVLLRQAGAKVPGTFGPSQEEWEAYGMQAPPY